jgi:hypothetical protein
VSGAAQLVRGPYNEVQDRFRMHQTKPARPSHKIVDSMVLQREIRLIACDRLARRVRKGAARRARAGCLIVADTLRATGRATATRNSRRRADGSAARHALRHPTPILLDRRR